MKLGEKAPNFDAETSEGKINFYDYLGDSWGILFSHPADFTPVCTTELGAAAKYKEEFDKLDVKVVALSVDGVESHKDWIHDINETQHTTVHFPVVADEDKRVSRLYDMIHPEEHDTQTVRSVYIIAPDKTIKLMITYPASTGRNFKELLRVIKSLQLTQKYKVSTPADWEEGDDVVISPSISNEDAKDMFPKGFKEVKPYLRLTPQPD